jgi:hypothetical protein
LIVFVLPVLWRHGQGQLTLSQTRVIFEFDSQLAFQRREDIRFEFFDKLIPEGFHFRIPPQLSQGPLAQAGFCLGKIRYRINAQRVSRQKLFRREHGRVADERPGR